jgi:hypothetical protein
MSADDEYVPSYIDKSALLDRWRLAAARGAGNSGGEDSGIDFRGEILEGANHAVEGEEAQERLMRIVKGFLDEVVAREEKAGAEGREGVVGKSPL